jgi:hypothetical protein
MSTRILSIIVIAAMVIFPSSAAAFETTPSDGETGFPVDGNIIIEFDNPMDRGAVEVDFSPDLIYPVARTWSNDDRILTLRPTVDLLGHRTYTVVVSGESLTGQNVVETFSFETEYHPSTEEDRRSAISGLIIPIFIIIVIVAIMAVYITMKGIHQKKGQ